MAVFLAAVVLGLSVSAIAPKLPPVAGGPALDIERRFSLAATPELEIRNPRGDMQVRAANVTSIEATARVRMYARQPGSDATARDYALRAIQTSNGPSEPDRTIIASDAATAPDALEVYIDYVILVPPGTSVRIDSRNGNITFTGPIGRLRVRGCNNDVHIRDARGHVDVQTSNGRIRVLDAHAGATLKTLNGSIYAHMKGGALEAETTNGVIIAHVLEPQVQECRLTSRNGGITVALKEGCEAGIDASTEFGALRADIPLAGSTEARGLRMLRTAAPASATRLKLETLNGNITIARSGL